MPSQTQIPGAQIENGTIQVIDLDVPNINGLYPSLTESRAQHSVFAGPVWTDGPATFRALVSDDLPAISNVASASQANTSSYPWFQTGSNIAYVGGNVGIGMANPQAKLDILGSGIKLNNNDVNYTLFDISANSQLFRIGKEGTIGSNIMVDSQIGAGVLNVADASPLQLGTSNTARMIITSDGKVGIGTITPLAKLDVDSPYGPVDLLAYPNGGFSVSNAGPLNQILNLGVDNGYTWIQSRDINNEGNTYPLALNPAGGNVGIGTTTPVQKLQVEGSTNATAQILIRNTSASFGAGYSSALLFVPISAFDGTTEALSGASIKALTSANYSTDLLFSNFDQNRATFAESMRITSIGNIGIGTTTPTAKLQVSNGFTNAIGLKVCSSPTNGTFIDENALTRSIAATVLGTGVGDTTGLALNVYTYTHDGALVVRGDGNVGIGTTSPSVKLSLGITAVDSTNSKIAVYDGGTSAIYGIGLSGNGTYAGLGLFANNTTTDAPKVFVESTGNVGIGTTTPSYKLDVSGSIRSTGTVYTSGGGAGGVGINPLATTNYIQSRQLNLITNGSGLLGNNYNFSSFTFDPADTYSGGGSFLVVGSANNFTDEFIPVDPTQTYTIGAWIKAGDVDGSHFSASNTQFFGFAAYDIDKNAITPFYFMHYPGAADTTLASTLNTGDTTMSLVSATGWYGNGNTGGGYQAQMAWYPYTNSFGYSYPNYTYTQNGSWLYAAYGLGSTAMWTGSGIVGNNISLTAPWPGPTLAAGTAVRNVTAGGTYKYNVIVGTAVPNTWSYYSGYMGGYDTQGNNSYNLFPYGTAYIKLLFLLNYGMTGDNHIRYNNLTLNISPTNTVSSSYPWYVTGGNIISAGGSVGIGTASPGAGLDVNGQLNYGARIYGNDPGNAFLAIKNLNSVGARSFNLVAGVTGLFQNGFSIYDTGLSATRLVIDNTGNVGIGTVIPAFNLDVSGSVISTTPPLRLTCNSNIGIRLDSTSANANSRNWFMGSNTYGYGYFGLVQSNTINGDPTTGTYRLLIDNNGNVGINTVTPVKMLDVAGSIIAHGNTDNISCYQYASNGLIAGAIIGYSYSTGSGYNTGVTGISISQVAGIGVNVGGYFNASNGSANYGLLVGAGNVGIGNTDPTSSLDVQGIVTIRAASPDAPSAPLECLRMSYTGYSLTQRYANSIWNSVSAADTLSTMQFRVSNGDTSQLTVMSLRGTGNVGIGITAPVNKLDVAGNISCSVITASLFNGTSSYAPNYVKKAGDNLTGQLYVGTSAGIAFQNSSNGIKFEGGTPNDFILQITDNDLLTLTARTGSVKFSGSNVIATASWAQNSVTASYASTASYSITAMVTQSINFQSSASWASQSLSASSLYNADNTIGLGAPNFSFGLTAGGMTISDIGDITEAGYGGNLQFTNISASAVSASLYGTASYAKTASYVADLGTVKCIDSASYALLNPPITNTLYFVTGLSGSNTISASLFTTTVILTDELGGKWSLVVNSAGQIGATAI